MVMLAVIDLLLMAFSIVLWKLGNDTLAATAGAGAIALATDIGRRLLAGPAAELPPLQNPPAPPTDREPGGERVA
jgi:hypothetical protein